MRKFKFVIIAVVAMLTAAMPAQAQLFRWGVKVGTNVNSLKLENSELGDNFKKENRAGFNAGVTALVNVPFLGFAFDASLMYVHRVNDFNGAPQLNGQDIDNGKLKKQDYLELPIHARYNFSFPIISKIVVPYVFTGPSFAVLCSKKSVVNGFKNKSFNTAWDLGLGVRLVNHLEIGASYAFGMSKVAEMTNLSGKSVDVGKRNYWTITAAYLF